MFSVAAATGLAKPFGVGVSAAPELLEGGRRPPQDGFAVANLTPLFLSTANANADRNHKNDGDIAYRSCVKSTPSGGLMKKVSPIMKAHLIRHAFCLLLLLVAVCVTAFALGQRLNAAPSPKDNPTGFVCMGCPSGITWRPGPDMPSTGVRMVGVLAPGGFYVMGGRSMDGVGNDFTHPFEYDPGSNTWAIKSATYPDNQVSNMACGVLTDSGTPYIYCVGWVGGRAVDSY